MASGDSVVAGSAGMAVIGGQQAPACGPASECKQALGDMFGSNVRSRKCKLRVRNARCCQPCGMCAQSPRLRSVATAGRHPRLLARTGTPASLQLEGGCVPPLHYGGKSFLRPFLQLADACLGQSRGALAKHRNCVSPCRPVRCGRGTDRAG